MFITGHTGYIDDLDFAFRHKDKACGIFTKLLQDHDAPYDEGDGAEEKAKSGVYLKKKTVSFK